MGQAVVQLPIIELHVATAGHLHVLGVIPDGIRAIHLKAGGRYRNYLSLSIGEVIRASDRDRGTFYRSSCIDDYHGEGVLDLEPRIACEGQHIATDLAAGDGVITTAGDGGGGGDVYSPCSRGATAIDGRRAGQVQAVADSTECTCA